MNCQDHDTKYHQNFPLRLLKHKTVEKQYKIDQMQELG